MLENHMKQLAEELEFENSMTSETPGIYVFPLDQDIKIYISSIPQGIYFECAVAPCPTTRQEELFTQLLLANLFGQGTRGAILGLSEDNKSVKLTQVLENKEDYQLFKDNLEDFVNSVDFWSEETLTYSK
ncbi:type III secretionT3S chaperone [Parachlamydia acanthamoebae UV-7]|jgi:hypothetical protein|uniref:Type III secretionT3S chaperone n=1 Tax=Parachlamydia acanthamoebae (strain UV7) TaxID=765952 RepID=F8KX15_PARAV|nr:CesT family type III secretion system chaperone [Parachlamydia acanthamoebae]CCB85482.1 type III secretionT3S chaperone [Parachlamydia acanthamoebae UV-7]CCB85485.1 type III secretionT3S chaperone [Parachlamydia acanthamoebae UV-7]